MKIAVVGSTGLVGRQVPPALLDAGHKVRALVRGPRPLDPRIDQVFGDALNESDLGRLVEGCDAVVNCAGRLQNAADFYAPITRGILAAMARHGVPRYLLITSSAVHVDGEPPSLGAALGRWGFSVVFPKMLADKQDEVALVRASSVQWTVFRLPVVRDGSPRLFQVSDRFTSWTITNGQVAQAIVEELQTNASVGRLPFLG